MNIKLKRIRIRSIKKNPLLDQLRAKKAQTFGKFRSKILEKFVA